jgi:hypothetical protein
MRKFMTVAGIVVIAAIALAWSRPTKVETMISAAPISPGEIMVKQGKTLPVENWKPAY